MLTTITTFFLQQLFPFRCILCNFRSDQNKDLCLACEKELPWIINGCFLCGEEIPLPAASHLCGECLSKPPPYERFLTILKYEGHIVSLIKQLKFREKLVIAHVLGDLLVRRIQSSYQAYPLPDVIIPIPLHKERLRQRGFNQALEIARVISRTLHLKIDYQTTVRHKNTLAQSSLSANKRRENIHKAFAIRAMSKFKHVAVVDDVVTTGNTVKEFSNMLKKNGVQQIDLWCLAKTPRSRASP